MTSKFLFLSIAVVGTALAAGATADISIYGPGGPTPAMKEAAAAFEDETGIAVQITAGPSSQWMEEAKADADAVDFHAEVSRVFHREVSHL